MNGALGDVRDRSGNATGDLSRWLLRGCSGARDQPRKGESTILECASDDEVSSIGCIHLCS